MLYLQFITVGMSTFLAFVFFQDIPEISTLPSFGRSEAQNFKSISILFATFLCLMFLAEGHNPEPNHLSTIHLIAVGGVAGSGLTIALTGKMRYYNWSSDYELFTSLSNIIAALVVPIGMVALYRHFGTLYVLLPGVMLVALSAILFMTHDIENFASRHSNIPRQLIAVPILAIVCSLLYQYRQTEVFAGFYIGHLAPTFAIVSLYAIAHKYRKEVVH
jgi:hypothetical protein